MGIQTGSDNKKVFRLSLMEDDTHKNIRSIRFTRGGMIVALITVAVILVATVYAIIALTPLKTTIPGYPDAFTKKVALQNAIKIDSLESAITRWELYAENLNRVLAGEQTITMDSIIRGNTVKYLSEKSREELARRDSLLRENVAQAERFDIEGKQTRSLPIEGKLFFQPLKGVVAQGFVAGIHPGIDISAPSNSVVYAVLDGTVIFSGWDETQGYMMHIQHPDNIVSAYKNCEKLLKVQGDKVKAGTPVAVPDDKLHFELWYKGEAVDPTKYIGF